MKIKLSIFLFSISAILSGCATTVSDGTHIKDLPMSRDFILEVPDPTPTTKVMAGNPKINSIKPDKQGTTKPRAVVLLDNTPFPFNLNVRRKNIIVCEGFMSLPSVDLLEQEGKNKGDEKSAYRKNHLITYMPAQKDAELPNTSKDCSKFISKGYDFINSKDEILYLIDKGNFKKIAKSPYIAIYESRTSPYSSMILSLGQLNPVAINRLTSNWPELLVKVYNHGDNIEDLTIGIATMLRHDPVLRQAQNDGHWENIQIAITAATCGGALAGTTITLNTLLATPACMKFYNQAKDALGYS